MPTGVFADRHVRHDCVPSLKHPFVADAAHCEYRVSGMSLLTSYPRLDRCHTGIDRHGLCAQSSRLRQWLKHSYVEPPKSAGVVFRLDRPLFKARGSEIAFAVNDSSLDYLSDTVQSGPGLRLCCMRTHVPWTRAHRHADIRKYGHGWFSRRAGTGFIFSSSDSTNPRSRGRTYWAVIPPSPTD